MENHIEAEGIRNKQMQQLEELHALCDDLTSTLNDEQKLLFEKYDRASWKFIFEICGCSDTSKN